MKLPSPDTPRGGTFVLVTLIVVSLLLTTLYFREGDTGALRAVRRGVMAASAPVAVVGDWVTAPFRATSRWVSGFTVSRKERDELRSQNALLRERVAALEESRLENARLHQLVGFAEANKLKSVGARVIGRPTNSWEDVVTIDRGSADKVAPGMPVLAQQGLLGQVVEVSARSSRVRLITDQHSGVAAMIQRTRGAGIVKGSIAGDLSLEFVGRESAPKRGDVVLTSGLGGVYPKGLYVGEVVSSQMKPNDLHPRVTIVSSVPFDELEEVLVLVGPPPVTQTGSGE